MLKIATAGESHGPGLVVIIEGMPSGVRVNSEYINQQLKRRQRGYGRGGRMNIEADEAVIMSGIRNGATLGSPIALTIRNRDYENWREIMGADTATSERRIARPRPGHADLTGAMKYHHNDFRNVLERASARETAARVAAGAICREFLEELNIKIYSQVVAIGDVFSPTRGIKLTNDLQALIEQSEVACGDSDSSRKMIETIDQAKANGESLGGCFEIVVDNVPPGIGSYVDGYRRLDSALAAALVSIPAIKAVEIGDGVEAAHQPGSTVHDEIFYNEERGIFREQNRAGGIEGGMSNGEPIIVRAYMKPIPTLYKPLLSVNVDTWQETRADIERSDVCAVPAARVVGEAMISQVLARELLEKLSGDAMEEIVFNYRGYLEYLEKVWKWKKTLF